MNSSGQQIEVEIKAWLDDPAAIEQKLKDRAEFETELEYRDTYFTYAFTKGMIGHRFRLREGPGAALVTSKEKTIQSKVEINLESEFEVSSPEAFRVFVQRFGFRVMIEKVKRLRRYRLRPSGEGGLDVAIELVEILGLGRFIEVEILLDNADGIGEAREMVRQVLEDLGIPEDRIEPQPYTHMLHQKQSEK